MRTQCVQADENRLVAYCNFLMLPLQDASKALDSRHGLRGQRSRRRSRHQLRVGFRALLEGVVISVISDSEKITF
jgi:hypothetical protein